MFLLIRQLKMKNTVDVNIFEELAPGSSDEGDSNVNEKSKTSSEILIKEDTLGENATDEGRKEDNAEGAEEEEENGVTSGSQTFTAECQPFNVVEEKELSQNDKPQHFGSQKRRKEEVASTLVVPLVEFGHVQKRKPLPTPPNQKEDDVLGKDLLSANGGSADVKIAIQHEDEPPGDDDDDNISPKDILCFAWQIAQGMVSEKL